MRIFVDGELSAVTASGWTKAWINNASTTSHSQIQLGNYRSVNGYQLRGSLSNFRIVQGSVPSAFKTTQTTPTTQVFTAPTTPTADPHTDGKLSVYFDGSNDYLSIEDTTDFTFGSGDFTIECWVYWDSVSGTQYVYGQSHTGGIYCISVIH